MRLTFHGAAAGVTGSCTLLETEASRLLVDAGMFQGPPRVAVLNRRAFPFGPRKVDAVVLTHAHVDHSGLLPRLVSQGFRGPIHCTAATADLCGILLADSARVQEADAEDENRWRRRAGRPLVKPLYSQDDVARAVERLVPHPYGEPFEPGRGGLRATFRDAGHILGSASVLFEDGGPGPLRRVLFSGDVGPRGQAIVRDPQPAPECDALVIESTYGDRDHPDPAALDELLLGVLAHARADGGALLIPAFAVGRAQTVLYHLKTLSDSKRLVFPAVYLDSPLAIRAAEIYRGHPECFDEEAGRRVREGNGLLWMPELHVLHDRRESMALNTDTRPKIVVAASGMCSGGPILHHLKHHLWRPEADVLFAGYQGEGTLGRRILDGAKHVKIHGRTVQVRASIHEVSGLSSHADRKGLLAWAESAGSPSRVFVNHGEPGPAGALAERLRARFPDADVAVPTLDEGFELRT
jgi:metallo-beta-lactamase family protein